MASNVLPTFVSVMGRGWGIGGVKAFTLRKRGGIGIKKRGITLSDIW